MEQTNKQEQASKMRFLQRIEGVKLFNNVHSYEIRKYLNIKPLLLGIKRLQLRWYGHVSRMPQERHLKQALSSLYIRVELSAAFVSFIITHRCWCILVSMSNNERNKNLHLTPLMCKAGFTRKSNKKRPMGRL